jgi:hypothetical protein
MAATTASSHTHEEQKNHSCFAFFFFVLQRFISRRKVKDKEASGYGPDEGAMPVCTGRPTAVAYSCSGPPEYKAVTLTVTQAYEGISKIFRTGASIYTTVVVARSTDIW